MILEEIALPTWSNTALSDVASEVAIHPNLHTFKKPVKAPWFNVVAIITSK